MDAYYSTPLAPFAPALGANFNTFTARQDVSPLPLPLLPGGLVRPGTCLKLEAEGEYSTAAATTPTLVLGFYLGAPGASGGGTITSILAESAALTTGSGVTSVPWRLEYRGKFTGVGTAGSITGNGNIELGSSLTAHTSAPIPITLALRTVAVNTTILNAIGVCATFQTSNASNNVRTYQITAMLQN